MERKIDKKGSLKFILLQINKSGKSLYWFYPLNIVLILIFSLSGILTPRFLISELMLGRSIKNLVVIIISFILVSSLTGFFIAFIKTYYRNFIFKIRFSLLSQVFEKIMRMPFVNLENPQISKNMWRVYSSLGNATHGVQGTLMRTFSLSAGIVSVFLYFGILFTLSRWMVAFLIINIVIVFLFKKKSASFQVKREKDDAPFGRSKRHLSRMMENLDYGKDVRIYGLSNFIVDRYKEQHKGSRKLKEDVENKYFTTDLVEIIMSLVRDSLLYISLIYSVLDGSISIAQFSMYFMTVATLTITLQTIFEDIAHISAQLEFISELKDFLSIQNEGDEVPSKSLPVPEAEHYEIEFKNLYFKYPNTEKYIFENLSFKIKHGCKLAVVGVNGAGKTTLVKLLARFYEPTQGEILINGVNINEYSLLEYRKLISAVFQEIILFAMTLEENIAGVDSEIDEAKILETIHQAGFTAKLDSLHSNIKTPLTKYLAEDGVELSGGEKQKLAIARAIYKDSKILFLDEPTSALDAIAEYNLYRDFAKISEGKTVLFISHRLASTRFCDEIALISGGNIAEYGTHDELMSKNGLYYEMFNTQKQYYEETRG